MNFKSKSTFIANILIGIALILGGIFYAMYNKEVLLTFNSAEKMYNDGYYLLLQPLMTQKVSIH